MKRSKILGSLILLPILVACNEDERFKTCGVFDSYEIVEKNLVVLIL